MSNPPADVDYNVRIQAPDRPESFAQLVATLEVGHEVVWNGREEPCTVTAIPVAKSDPSGIGKFQKRLVLENEQRSNGGRFRLTFEEGLDASQTWLGDGIPARCHVQRHVGERGNDQGWGRCTEIESLGWIDPAVDAEPEAPELATDGGGDEHSLYERLHERIEELRDAGFDPDKVVVPGDDWSRIKEQCEVVEGAGAAGSDKTLLNGVLAVYNGRRASARIVHKVPPNAADDTEAGTDE